MPWTGFDGRAYTRDQFAAHVADLAPHMGWVKGVTLHNTASPTLAQWAESGPNHDARIRNLQSYYENELGWHAGPHLFISRDYVNGFSDLTRPGVHSRCFNATHIGIECVGDYNVEEWDFGDGEKVRDNAVFALATLYRALNLSPDGLVFHKECLADNHDCPGRKVIKADVIARVKALWKGLPATPEPEPVTADQLAKMAHLQAALNECGAQPPLMVDGRKGDKTRAALRAEADRP